MNYNSQNDETTDMFFQLAERQHQQWQTVLLTLPDLTHAERWFNVVYVLETFVRHVYSAGFTDSEFSETFHISSTIHHSGNSNPASLSTPLRRTTCVEAIEICLRHLPTFEQLGVSIFAQAFIEVCKAEGIYTPKESSSQFLLKNFPLLGSFPNVRLLMLASRILESLRARMKRHDFVLSVNDQKDTFQNNYQELAGLIEKCFHHSNQLFVIRADLGYPECISHSTTLTTAKLRRDLGRFLQMLKDSVWTADVVGYIAQIEYNRSIHIVLFADALKQTENHAYWQKIVFDLWQRVTTKEGVVYFVNEPNSSGWLTISKGASTQPIDRMINYFAKSSYYLSTSSKSIKHKLFMWSRLEMKPFDYSQPLLELVKRKEDKEDIARLDLLYQEIALHRQPDDVEQALNRCLCSRGNLSVLFQLELFFIALKYDQRDFFEHDPNTDHQSFYQLNPVGRYLWQFRNQFAAIPLLKKLAVEQNLQLSRQFELLLAGINKHLARANAFQFEEHNKFLKELRSNLDDTKFRKASNIIKSNRTAAFNSVTEYINAIFRVYKDLHVLSLNLYPFGSPFSESGNGKDPNTSSTPSEPTQGDNSELPSNTCTPKMREVSLKEASKLFTLFIKKAKQPKTIKGLVGYVGKWEVDSKQKLYAHVIFLFQSNILSTEARNSLLTQLGNEWSLLTNLTQGNVSPAYILAEDVPQKVLNIAYKDLNLRRKFITQVATYLTLSDMYVKSSLLAKQTLLKGDSPNPKPRKKKQSKAESTKAPDLVEQ